MDLGSPFDALNHAYISACGKDASDIVYKDRDWQKYRDTGEDVRIEKSRRPEPYDIAVYAMFPQTWGSTALGFGGMGGASMTPAYTIVLENDRVPEFLVYFGGRFAYKVPATQENRKGYYAFIEDLRIQQLVEVSRHGRYLAK